MDVLDTIRETVQREKLLFGAETVICALSGGADSVCLAHAMCLLAPEWGVKVECAHFNHLLRGAESERDEAFVRRWCEARGVKLTVERGDAAAFAAERHLSIETAARELRYAFFDRLGDAKTRIATAHQADDQAETLLLHLARGSGLKGLCGIPPVRGRFIRPLLDVTRDEVLDYLAQNGLDHVEDSTNAEDAAARNRLRHGILPVLKELNPDFSRTVGRTVRLLREDEAALNEMASELLIRTEDGLRLSSAAMIAAPKPLASRAVRLAAAEWDCIPAETHVRQVLALAESRNPSAAVPLPGGLTAARQYDGIAIEPASELPGFAERTLVFGTWTEVPELDIQIWYGDPTECCKVYGKFTTWFFKKEQICGNMTVRPRTAGDFLRLPGRPGKTLKKWMTENRIPAKQRNRQPVFADDTGVLAAMGIGADVRAAADAASADAVIIVWERT